MECGECTLCCEILPIRWLNKPPNSSCIFCDKGCTIHSDKASECTDFNCAYVMSPNAGINLRPDKSHMIFEMWSDNLFYGIQDARYEVTDAARGQIIAFLNQGYSVICAASDGRKPEIHVAAGHNKEEIIEQWQRITQTSQN